MVVTTLDLDGNPRVTDGDGDGVAVVDMGAFEVCPKTMLPQLKAYILEQVALGNIDAEIEMGLLAKVEAAIVALNRGHANDIGTVINALQALINQVEGQTGQKITAEAAAGIIERIGAIMAILGG